MRRRILIVLAALVLAGLSGTALLLYARGVDQRAVDGRKAVSVLLAEERIPAGTTAAQIREKKLARTVVMPADSLPDDTVGSLDKSLDGLALSADLQPDQLLLRGQFSRPDTDSSAAVGVPDGDLGVSVEVTMAPGVAEKVAAGDKVTVFVTYPKDARPSDQKTRILLPDATVISITTGPPSDVTPAPTSTRNNRAVAQSYPATLAVDQDDAVRLVHAAQTGSIYLGLLGETTKVSPSPGVDYDSLWP
ncbi:Flp pilus assembly protein CpaB [Actinoplanes friuliensis]|uniref:Flp pilus assembly protein CpaB n=1 Tax=Actinoplanes friuliensis DSM 7358 TaxID=1246995 RepID=U5VVB9_9ACTN|nr:RcpC/CpaB family pilus assembly protein [Actinoplanes friuliensis]AGZ39650.1 Flp pilus assembly protein CpaB [Actinoplanes friuliensis DSM 7358]